MSHALHTDVTSAGRDIAGYGSPRSRDPMSLRAAGFVVCALSAAGWLGIVIALRQLIG